MLNVNAVAYGLPHPSVANYLTVDLTVLREMAQALADLFGLTLPVSQKKLVEALSYSVYPCSVSPTEIPEGRVTPACQQMLKW